MDVLIVNKFLLNVCHNLVLSYFGISEHFLRKSTRSQPLTYRAHRFLPICGFSGQIIGRYKFFDHSLETPQSQMNKVENRSLLNSSVLGGFQKVCKTMQSTNYNYNTTSSDNLAFITLALISMSRSTKKGQCPISLYYN